MTLPADLQPGRQGSTQTLKSSSWFVESTLAPSLRYQTRAHSSPPYASTTAPSSAILQITIIVLSSLANPAWACATSSSDCVLDSRSPSTSVSQATYCHLIWRCHHRTTNHHSCTGHPSQWYSWKRVENLVAAKLSWQPHWTCRKTSLKTARWK